MTETAAPSPRNVILRRICLIQVAGIVIATLLLFVMLSREFGFFWHSFMIGGLGASIALQRKITQKSQEELEYLAGDRIAISMPILYGAVMATVAYGLFMSNLVSGDPDGGLLSSNVFPVFVVREAPMTDEEAEEDAPSETPPAERPTDEAPPEETPSDDANPAETPPGSTGEETNAETDPEKDPTSDLDEADDEPQSEEETIPSTPPETDDDSAKETESNPKFRVVPDLTMDDLSSSASEQGEGVTWADFFRMRPASTRDLGKLFVWCFLAGYSESFVTGLLSRLEQTGGRSGGGTPSESDSTSARQPATRRKRSR